MSAKRGHSSRRYLEDLEIGVTSISSSHRINGRHMLAFAREYDPQYFHASPRAARTSRFGGLIASGIYTMAVWRQLDHELAGDIAWICGVAWENVRFAVALRAGDRVHARATCMDKRVSASDATRGVVKIQYELINQREQVVFSALSVNLVECRPRLPSPQAASRRPRLMASRRPRRVRQARPPRR
ncbi:MAG: MaoC/PaaZ C-terminal domain-containing protein [Steroidobacteraceae bacterium]